MTLERRRRRQTPLTDPCSTAPAILLIGKTGSGKSTLANMLFDSKNKFLTSDKSDSCTKICQSALWKLNDNKVYNLIDTPGFFDTTKPDDEIMKEISKSLVQCCYGIIAILYVMAWGRYTAEQQSTTEKILEFLGQESYHHLIIVFTKCNKKQTKNRFLMENDFNDDIRSLLNKAKNRWVISPDLDKFDEENDPYVNEHMDKLRDFIMQMSEPYTTALFEKIRIPREKRLRELCEFEEKVTKLEEKLKIHDEKIIAGTKIAEEEFKKNGCFSLRSKVILADGRRVNASQLRIGDNVCCGVENGKLIFSEIYAIVHSDNQTMTQYQQINYSKADGTEGTLRLTPKHHLFVSQGKTIFAEDVKAGVTELLLFDDKKLIPVIPHLVVKELELGYIAPFTKNGKIIVDEILCSCYAVAPPYQEIINFAMIPFRLYSQIMPITYCKKEIHPYLRCLSRSQWILELIDYFNTKRLLES